MYMYITSMSPPRVEVKVEVESKAAGARRLWVAYFCYAV